MAYQVGIDVGGTFTDGVLIHENRLINKTKVPTQQDNLLDTLLDALDHLEVFKQPVQQITVSTTLVTNAILERKLPPVELFLFPGSGMKLDALSWPVSYHPLKGEIDYRGRQVAPPDELEWRRISNLDLDAVSQVAIVSKFSHRNKILEENLAQFLSKRYPHLDINLGCEWGHANFYRRSLTTYLNTASKNLHRDFSNQLHQAVEKNGSKAKITVLKADGGILPSDQLRPVESINSGPAASVIGALAQTDSQQSFVVVVDIGGTTTDIGLILSGEPLMSSQGAQIGPYLTLIPTLATRSIPIGGDSTIIPSQDAPEGFTIAPYRKGQAYCLGGEYPTPTDAMRYLKRIELGNYERAAEGLASLLPPDKRTPESLHHLAIKILEKFAGEVAHTFYNLHKEWQEEPAYKVWEVLHPQSAKGFYIWVSGGSAQGIAPSLEDHVHLPVRFTEHADVSNAIGAALARPTFSCTLHLDTYVRTYRIEEFGEQGEWRGSRRPHKEVQEFLHGIALDKAQQIGLNPQALEFKSQPFDFFPVVKGYETVGQIIRGSVLVPPGVIGRLKV